MWLSVFRRWALTLAVGFVFAQVAEAQIVRITRGGGSTNDPPMIAPTGLGEDALCFVDRTHEYNNVPALLVGRQYVMVANNDKSVADYSLEVELGEDANLFLILDNRIGDNDAANGPTLGGGVMDWVLGLGFADSGLDIGIDEGGDGDIENTSSVWFLPVAGGSVVVLEQDDGGSRNMYGVAAEPLSESELPAVSHAGLALLILLLLAGGALAVRRTALAC